jgi:multidrug resistance efflux pump
MSTTAPSPPGTRAPPADDSSPTAIPSVQPSPKPRPVEQHARHRPARLVLMLALLLLVGAVAWWLITTQPWVQAPGPLTASGTLEAKEILVGSEVAGRIVDLTREGNSIEAGGTVARLDDSLIQLQMRQADTATYQQLQIQLDRYLLRSPVSGVVTRVPMHVGEVVSPGQTVAAVADLTYLEFTAYVLERDLGQVRVGQRVTVRADPFPGRGFAGVVTSTNQRSEFTPRNVQTQRDRLNLVFGVKVRVANPDGALKPGMPADATFAPVP